MALESESFTIIGAARRLGLPTIEMLFDVTWFERPSEEGVFSLIGEIPLFDKILLFRITEDQRVFVAYEEELPGVSKYLLQHPIGP